MTDVPRAAIKTHSDFTVAAVPTSNYQGLWWAAPGGSEAGWGINFAHQGDTIFASWFTYDLTGKGTWLVMTANKIAPNTYSGALLQGTGPAFDAVPFPPLGSPGGATVSGLGGTGTLTFSDANNGTFAYTLGGMAQSKAITRELIGPQPTCLFGALMDLRLAVNYTDLWWAAPAGSEAGWGINLTHEGDTIFATWYTFDVDHTPLWLVVTASKTAPGVYAGTPVYRLTGPPFSTMPFPPLGSPGGATGVGVGSASFTFSDGNTAVFNYTVEGVTQSKTITREVFTAPGTACTSIPVPSGIYVLNEASNEQPTTTAYASGLTASPAYASDVAGHAIFTPIAKILPSVTTWGQFNWDWSYLDSLVQIALSNGKKFSVELETGFQSSSTYLQSLPTGFAAACGSECAPLFDVWTTGGGAGRCISAYVLLPWIPNVQTFWSAAAFALAAHLKQTGAYDSLTLVHLPGLSVYDEEIRLPTGLPKPASTDTQTCPDGRSAVTAVVSDASTARWQLLGYTDNAAIAGFDAIATAFAQAFPDRFLGLSMFPPGANGIDFPNLTSDTVGYVASRIAQTVTAIAPGRVQIQADNLDSNYVEPEVGQFAAQYGAVIGWQTNKHAGSGAGCDGGGAGSCNPDGATGPFVQLLQNGANNGARYLEVWSADVVNYPQGFAAAKSSGYYPAR